MRFLILRLEAPMMAFGGVAVDSAGPTRSFPGQAQVCGLLANALGWDHADAPLLEGLQRRLRLAAALVRPGERLRDYQTVDLGQPHLAGTGWTTRGRMEERAGASGETTHIRQRWYLADACVRLALTLDPPDDAPTLDDLRAALDHPARPLFIGRKSCLPTAPLAVGLVEAEDAQAALQPDAHCACEYDLRLRPDADPAQDDIERVVDGRDWRLQMHLRERSVVRPLLGAGR